MVKVGVIKKRDPLAGKVLVPKIGMVNEFLDALQKMVHIAHGSLGWEGQADMMIALGLMEGTKEEVMELIQQSFLSEVMQYGEWVTKKEAETRKAVSETLYGQPNIPTAR